MRLREDWLNRVVTVPYVPTLGPVHPSVPVGQLFADVLRVAGTGAFLVYDNDRRWFNAKTETVLADDVVHEPDETLVPVLSLRGARSVSVHVYGDRPGSHATGARLARQLGDMYGAANTYVVSFASTSAPPAIEAHVTRIQLHELTSAEATAAPEPLWPLDDCPAHVRASFPSFANALATEGFMFLRGHMGSNTGPILVAVEADRIVGAIGPMQTMADPNGTRRALPPYFGVHPDHRGRGHGRALWRAAEQWGIRNDAEYQLLQTKIGGAADHICRTEGARSLGVVCRVAV